MDSEPREVKKSLKRRIGIRRPQILSNQWVSMVLFIAGVAAAYFFIQGFLIRTYLVDGQSMEATLQSGDRLIINKVPRSLSKVTGNAYIPHRGDIVVFNQSGLSLGSVGEKQLIKRVVGLPGERVVVKNGSLIIYSPVQPGGYEPDKTGLYHIGTQATPGNLDITLGRDEIFVCGDNRANSEDSRYFGPIKENKIVGKLALRFLPPGKVRSF